MSKQSKNLINFNKFDKFKKLKNSSKPFNYAALRNFSVFKFKLLVRVREVAPHGMYTKNWPLCLINEHSTCRYNALQQGKLAVFLFSEYWDKIDKTFKFSCQFRWKVPQFEPDSVIILLGFASRIMPPFRRESCRYCNCEFYNCYRTLCSPLLTLSALFPSDKT